MIFRIEIPGRPAPQGSKRSGSAGQMLEGSDYLPAWKRAINIAAFKAYAAAGLTEDALPLFKSGVPLHITQCTFYVGPDQCRAAGTIHPVEKPDIDKLLRGLLDGLGGGRRDTARVFADDSQIVSINNLSKQRIADPTRTGAIIVITDGKD